MRWDSQRVDREKGRSLPGLDVERVRTFDAPEALGINFHEVRAKSALNKVPGDFLPFNWTVNAFRGCAHACTLLPRGRNADPHGGWPEQERSLTGGWRSDLRHGSTTSNYRRYAARKSWLTGRPTRRHTGSDSRTGPNWSRAAITVSGPGEASGSTSSVLSKVRLQRPHLTSMTNWLASGSSRRAGHGRPVNLPPRLPVRPDPWDGNLACIAGPREIDGDRSTRPAPHSGLRSPTSRPLIRARTYSSLTDPSDPEEFLFRGRDCDDPADESGDSCDRNRAGYRADQRCDQLAAGHRTTTGAEGFLGGIFDAEGCFSQGILRIANADPEIIDWTTWLPTAFRLRPTRSSRPARLVTGSPLSALRGGLAQKHAIPPHVRSGDHAEAVDRRDVALKSDANLGVDAIEPLGKRPACSTSRPGRVTSSPTAS